VTGVPGAWLRLAGIFLSLGNCKMSVCDVSGRMKQAGCAYAGDVTAQEAWSQLQSDPSAVLVDVRSEQEWAEGIPDLQDNQKNPHLISWRFLPSRELNAQFMEALDSASLPKDTPIYFMCKGGGRSSEAAAEASAKGYQKSYNILGGFLADGGWVATGLPWKRKT